MSTYVIGDIQGCLTTLERLVDLVSFVPGRDRLVFVGDLVNRGPRSLDTLRFVRSLGTSGLTVLGNHDLHLLGVAAGLRRQRAKDTLDDILAAADGPELLRWLARQPLLLDLDGWIIVHAGLLPCWSLDQARHHAREVERALQTANGLRAALTTPFPDHWTEELHTPVRVSMALAILTRVRMCRASDRPDFEWKLPPADDADGLFPWYTAPHPSWASTRICFGHWASLDFRPVPVGYALDSGCVWGRTLTALRLEDERVFQVPAQECG